MKKQGVVWIAVLLLAGSAWGQYGYLYQSGGWMFGTQFIGQEGWMVGGGGAILHTMDGGRNWLFQRNIQGYDAANPELFNQVAFKTPREGWVLSFGQTFWHTSDGGQFWERRAQISNRLVDKFSFADSVKGWFVGGSIGAGNISATTDGGWTWVVQSQNHPYYGVYTATQRHCWAVGYLGWVARTNDGGQNWLEQQIGSIPGLYDVVFTDTLYGWACGDQGAIVRTTDGGVSWAAQTSGTPQELYAILFLDRSHGFAGGDSGAFIKTTDGGASWTSVSTGVVATFSSLSFGDTQHGWAIGAEGGVILATSDGGATWRVIQQGPAGHAREERIQAISFSNDTTGWAATWEGNIWHTHDGGKIWSKQHSVGPKRLLGLTMANANTGWAVGDSGRVFATQNGGGSWTQQTSGSLKTFRDIFESDALHAWACGNQQTVIGSTDGGQNWKEQFFWPDTTLYDITFCDSISGWALFEDGHLLRTRNTGQSWEFAGQLGRGNWYTADFVDSAWGWAAGDSGMSLTIDGGKSWSRQSIGTPRRLWGVKGINRQRAWTVGDSGKVLVTTNGGVTWSLQITPVTITLRAVDFTDSLRGVACGEDYIIYTRDGGTNWSLSLGGGGNFTVTLVDSLEGWAGGSGPAVFHTTDGGMNWQANNPGVPGPFRTVSFVNRDEGWVAGGQNDYRVRAHTTNRGTSWVTIYESPLKSPIYSLCFMDSLRGWFGTGSEGGGLFPGQMHFTTDRGRNWRMLGDSKNAAISGNATTFRFGGVSGSQGLLLRTVDGATWERVWGPTTKNLWGLSFGDDRTGWTAGWNGIRLKTTDQGVSWQMQQQDTVSVLTSVQSFDSLNARMIGYLGRSVLTTDGGMTWMKEETGTDEWLLASSFFRPTLGWVAGEDGMVLKYGLLPSGIEDEGVETAIPWKTALEQNRPNPFFTGTRINYQLSRQGPVRLVVYNILGQAVKKLVNEVQKPGTYSTSWDGCDAEGRAVSNGVYFYRLETQAKSQTRKMVKVR